LLISVVKWGKVNTNSDINFENGIYLYTFTPLNTKDGVLSEPVPYHGSKEFYEPPRKKIAKRMGLK